VKPREFGIQSEDASKFHTGATNCCIAGVLLYHFGDTLRISHEGALPGLPIGIWYTLRSLRSEVETG
jgi:hypothetical protein